MKLAMCLLLAAAASAGGCSTAPETRTVSFGSFSEPRPMMFGAGDALGQEMFTVYVASLELDDADFRFATADSAPAFRD